jgi:hypothetical protein
VRDRRSGSVLYYACAMLRFALRSRIEHRTWLSCLQYIFYLKSCSKGPILTIFRGLADRHLRGICLLLGMKRCYNMFAPCYDVILGLGSNIVHDYLKSCSKGPILTIFRGLADRHLHGVLFISRGETAFYMFVLCHNDVSLSYSKKS